MLSVIASEDVAEKAEVKSRVGSFKMRKWSFSHQLRFVFGQAFHGDAEVVMMPDVIAVIVDVPAPQFAGADAASIQPRISA